MFCATSDLGLTVVAIVIRRRVMPHTVQWRIQKTDFFPWRAFISVSVKSRRAREYIITVQ